MRTTLLLGALLATLGAAPVHQQPPSTSAPSRSLEVDAVAVDRQGNLVADLKPDDVEVWVEGYRIPLESLTALSEEDGRRRRSIALILDDVTITPDLLARIRQAAQRVVERLEPGDTMSIGTLSGGGLLTAGQPAVLRQAIERFNLRATGLYRPDDLGAHVFATLTNIARQVAERPGHRKTVITIGPGWVFDTPVPPPGVSRDLREEWTTAVRAMALSNVALYVIDPGGVGRGRASSGSGGLADDTGGHAFMNTNDMAGTVDRIMKEASGYYILRFEDPPFFRSAPLRKLEVRSKRDDVTIRARGLIPGTPARRGK